MPWSKNIEETLEMLHKDIELLQEQAEDTLPVPMKVEAIMMPWVRRSIEGEFKPKDRYGNCYGSPTPTVEAVNRYLETANSKIDSEVVEIEKVHEANLPAIENNLLISDKVHTFMKKIGISKGYSSWGYKTSRSRTTTETKHVAGFIGDLTRVITTKDNYSGVERSAKDYKYKLKEYADKLKKTIFEEQRKKDATERAKKKLKVFATLCVKYDLDAEAEDYDIREAILAKDKYLHLAYWLERNRGDWNDGYSFAETGLDGFTVETAEDKDIVADISSYIEDWDGDGRVFRDCEYNYSVLYGMADEALVKDLQTLQEYMEEY